MVRAMFGEGGIAPHFFQLVKGPLFGVHYVHYYVYKVYQHPFAMLLSFYPVGDLASFFLHLVLYTIGNGFYLHGGAGLAYHKKVGYRFVYLSQIQRYHRLGFLIKNAC